MKNFQIVNSKTNTSNNLNLSTLSFLPFEEGKRDSLNLYNSIDQGQFVKDFVSTIVDEFDEETKKLFEDIQNLNQTQKKKENLLFILLKIQEILLIFKIIGKNHMDHNT